MRTRTTRGCEMEVDDTDDIVGTYYLGPVTHLGGVALVQAAEA